MEYNSERNVYMERDLHGTAIRLSHIHTSLFIPGDSAQVVASRYLKEFGDLFGLKRAQLKKISLSHAREDEDSFTTTVLFFQTEHGLSVWNAGIRVQMRSKSFRILFANSTVQFGLKVAIPSKDAITKAESISEDELSMLLLQMNYESSEGFDNNFISLKIKDRSLIIHHFENPRSESGPRGKPDSGHYICVKIIFDLIKLFMHPLRLMAILEVQNLSILQVTEISDFNDRMFFENIYLAGRLSK